MAAYTAHTAKTQTLGVATVDSVLLDVFGRNLQIVHGGAIAAAPIFITFGKDVASTATPSSGGDDCLAVLAGTPLTIPWPLVSGGSTACVKLICATGEKYTVQVIQSRN